MLAGIRDIMIIATDEDQNDFKRLLGDGHSLKLTFPTRCNPSQRVWFAALNRKNFIANNKVVNRDNIWGSGLSPL